MANELFVEGDGQSKADFFISYNERDEGWAEWISWHLEQAGLSVIVQAWDFAPGSNFVLAMDRATKQAERTLVVLSPNFFASNFAPAEWASAFARDPQGKQHLLVPVRVQDVDIEGLLGQIVYIDLVGKSQRDAAQRLIAGVRPGRSKPTVEPRFPEEEAPRLPSEPIPVRSADVDWQPVAEPPVVIWRTQLSRYRDSGHLTTIEVALIPTVPSLLQVRQLAALPGVLTELGRRGGLFSATQEVMTDAGADYVVARSGTGRDVEDSGIFVTRQGQRSGWISLPHDSLGSVFDEAELGTRLASVIGLIASLKLPIVERLAVTASIGPTMMLTVGSAAIVGNRSSASMMSLSGERLVLPVEDSVSIAAISSGTEDVAAELLARIAAALRQ